MIQCTSVETPLGPMLAAATDGALCGLWFYDQNHFPKEAAGWAKASELELFSRLTRQLDCYFQGTLREFDLPLAPQGTPFRQEVWDLLRAIPMGETTTYGHLARAMAARRGLHSMSAQAVGGAVGHNPLSILIPCHRVIGADGSLTGYDGGILRKQALLKLEGCLPTV